MHTHQMKIQTEDIAILNIYVPNTNLEFSGTGEEFLNRTSLEQAL